MKIALIVIGALVLVGGLAFAFRGKLQPAPASAPGIDPRAARLAAAARMVGRNRGNRGALQPG